ncbi:MAG: histidine triad nucleotide-binding protein [Clostridia bacterium]|nr:histidine triad nucleotide-binding protein [Clostridia bacterium]
MENCIFCKIANGEIPSNKVYEDEFALAFRDIEPQAPIHILVVPKVHVENVMLCDSMLMAKLISAANIIVRDEGLAETGFRLVINTGKDGNQSVPHLHIHILGGRLMQWPPG